MTTPAQSAGSTPHAANAFGCGASCCGHGFRSTRIDHGRVLDELNGGGVMRRKKPWCKRAKPRGISHLVTVGSIHRRHCRTAGIVSVVYYCVPYAMMMIFLMLLFGILLGILGFSASASVAYFKLVVFMFFSVVLANLCGIAVGYQEKKYLKKMVLPSRCQLCLHCLYDLSARPRNDDTCPECGAVAPRRECVRLWCKLLRSRF